AAGFGYTFVPRQPGFVCQIDGLPDPCNGAPATAYWAYWHGQPGGSWTYSNEGAGSYTPPPGSVEGWAFGARQQPGTPHPPRPAPGPTTPTARPATARPPTVHPTSAAPGPSRSVRPEVSTGGGSAAGPAASATTPAPAGRRPASGTPSPTAGSTSAT